MYQFKSELGEGFFMFPHHFIDAGNWASLSTASQAVLPVLCRFANEKGISFPSELTLAIVSGRDLKVVRKAMNEIADFPSVSVERYITEAGHRARRFTLSWLTSRTFRAFPIRHMMFDGGNWSRLTPSAQALYFALRRRGKVIADDMDDDADDYTPSDFNEEFPNRKHEFCDAEIGILCDDAGIARRSYYESLKSLTENFLVELDDEYGLKVFLEPPQIWNRAWLNRNAKKRFGGRM